MFLEKAYQTYTSQLQMLQIYEALQRAASPPENEGGEGTLASKTSSGRKKEKPRAGAAASTKAILTRKARYGSAGLNNATKIQMRKEGQNVS